MNIVFDGRSITRKNTSGIPEYAKLLFEHLLELKDEDEKYSLFFNTFLKHKTPDMPVEYGCEIINWGISNKLLQCISRFSSFPRIGMKKHFDVLLRPHFHPLRTARGVKDVLVIHDLSFVRSSHFFSKKKTLWHWLQNPRGQARKADHIITISNATKEDIVNFYKISPNKISVVYSGINDFFREDVSADEIKTFRRKNNIEEHYILFVGTLEPRKNIEGLVRAFSILKNNKKFNNLSLVIVGAKGWLYDRILKEVALSPYASQIRLWGHASFEDLRFLYKGASVFVFPSLFEGFGFPPLEAQACGTPVISSACGGLSETLGESALIINPEDDKDIARAIYSVLTDETLCERLRKEGKKNSDRFQWKETARAVKKILRKMSI